MAVAQPVLGLPAAPRIQKACCELKSSMLVLAPVPAYKVPSHFLVGSCNWMQHITRMMKNQQVQLSLDRSHSILTVQCAVAPTGPIKQEPSSVQSRVQLYFSWSRKNLKINCSGLIVTYTFSIFFSDEKVGSCQFRCGLLLPLLAWICTMHHYALWSLRWPKCYSRRMSMGEFLIILASPILLAYFCIRTLDRFSVQKFLPWAQARGTSRL